MYFLIAEALKKQRKKLDFMRVKIIDYIMDQYIILCKPGDLGHYS